MNRASLFVSSWDCAAMLPLQLLLPKHTLMHQEISTRPYRNQESGSKAVQATWDWCQNPSCCCYLIIHYDLSLNHCSIFIELDAFQVRSHCYYCTHNFRCCNHVFCTAATESFIFQWYLSDQEKAAAATAAAATVDSWQANRYIKILYTSAAFMASACVISFLVWSENCGQSDFP